MLSVKVKINGLEKMRAAIKRIEQNLDRPSGFMGYAGAQGIKEITRHFENEHGPEAKWMPLAASTIARRRKKSSKPLQDTGRLKASIIWTKVGEAAIKFWSLVKYAKMQQEGSDKNNVPGRPFLWFPDDWVRDITEKFRKYVLKRF